MNVLLNEEQLRDGVRRLAAEIQDFYHDRPLTIVSVLTGSIVFLADLIRQLDLPLRIGLVQASSYRGRSTSPGPLVVNSELLSDIEGRDILLVDDIYDTGNTLLELFNQLDGMRPASVRSAVLLKKQGRRQVSLEPDHVAFEIPDVFVVGYGLDYNDAYRHLPYVAALEPEELTELRE